MAGPIAWPEGRNQSPPAPTAPSVMAKQFSRLSHLDFFVIALTPPAQANAHSAWRNRAALALAKRGAGGLVKFGCHVEFDGPRCAHVAGASKSSPASGRCILAGHICAVDKWEVVVDC